MCPRFARAEPNVTVVRELVRSDTFKPRAACLPAHTFRTWAEPNAELTRLLAAACLAYTPDLPRQTQMVTRRCVGRCDRCTQSSSQRLLCVCGDTKVIDRKCTFTRQALRRQIAQPCKARSAKSSRVRDAKCPPYAGCMRGARV